MQLEKVILSNCNILEIMFMLTGKKPKLNKTNQQQQKNN